MAIPAIGLIAALLVIGLLTVGFYAPWPRVPPGIRINGIPFGGWSFDNLGHALASWPPVTKTLRLVASDRSVTVEVQVVPDVTATVASVRGYARTGSFAERVRAWRALQRGVDLPARYTLEPRSRDRAIDLAREGFEQAPADARLVTQGDEVTIAPAVEGRAVNVKELAAAMADAVATGQTTIEVPLLPVPPLVSTADIQAMGVSTLMARFTTRFNTALVERSHNIALAASIIDGTLIPPGGRFSFNTVVGPRTAERGFQEAMVIQEDAFVPGLGGGVCQVSSTLYRAVLAAGLQVVERHSHSLPVAYIPLGLDATVSYGGPDLVFLNNTPYYVLLTMRVSGSGELTARVFGGITPADVRFETVTTELVAPPVRYIPDRNLGPGQFKVIDQGQYGQTVETYAVYPDGRRKLISISRYRPMPVQVLVGSGGQD